MLTKIIQMLMDFCERRGRVLEITGRDDKDDVYLIRYYLVRSKYFNIFIHQFLRSDRDDLHDHPWDFCTYLVRGSYVERKWNEKKGEVERFTRTNTPALVWGDVNGWHEGRERIKYRTFVFRRATDQHQVLVDQELKRDQKHLAPLTICVTGPQRREWGFIKEATASSDGRDPYLIRTWVDWREYLGLPKDTPGRG